MEDGILAAPATYSAPSAYYSPTAGRMAAIEVLKGSSQIADGPHTTGGVINYISTPIPSINEKGNLLKASYGSDNEISLTSRIGKTIQKESGKFGYLFEVYRRQNEGFKSIDQVGEMDGSNETGFNRTDYMFKGPWEPNSIPICLIASKKGNDSISPTVPPISTRQISASPAPLLTLSIFS